MIYLLYKTYSNKVIPVLSVVLGVLKEKSDKRTLIFYIKAGTRLIQTSGLDSVKQLQNVERN